MDRKNLLSIGELAKITGVHIKALRYYDSLGILKPAFVDPSSGYRYYSFYQKATVEAIQLCVELNIPLRQFSEYTNVSASCISYADLIQHGEEAIENKIKILQERLVRLNTMRAEIKRAENSFQSSAPAKYTLPPRDCWIVPYEGKQLCEKSSELTKKVIMDIHRNDLTLGNIGGLLLMPHNNEWKQFLFVDVSVSSEEISGHPEILHIPAGIYLCKKVDCSNIRHVWDWCLPLVKESQIQLVIETELFTGTYHFSAPALEQRCFLTSLEH